MSATLRVRVTPRSSRDEVIGWQDGSLRVRVRAAPVDGQANEAVCRLVAKFLGTPSGAVTLANGHMSRLKTLHIEGTTEEELDGKLYGL